jgi:succinyl-CoA synthetase alpha subunit
MKKLITKPFNYYVGLYSLEELVTKESRVCVINILGTESRKVTPVSHEYSGGNVVAGVQYGRRGSMETKIGDIPVYRSVRDVMKHGHEFDIGVIYLPPAAVSQAVWELTSFNKNLKRVVIVTEKVSIHDSRNVRFICQDAGVDVIGANCLGVANVWDKVRVGGALGGDNPEETLKKGSIAIHSNSGNFTTTIAEYLRTAGFGLSTVVSSGKDVYIHFALPEFLFAAQNDPRTRAVALYVEPGGYYEKQALEWIADRRFGFNKPIVVCVTGRWKKDLVRSCGHAGAMAGSGDDAESKERWFDEYFGRDVFDPQKPDVSKKGIRVASIQHIPDAMTEVFKRLDEKPDFEPSGDLNLKLWVSDGFVTVPDKLNIPIARALPPYDKQIAEINKQVGANFLRQNMRNKSGASRMDSRTQVAELHGKPVLELSKRSYEENIYFALAKVMPDKRDLPALNLLLNHFTAIEDSSHEAAEAARKNGASPNGVLAAHIAGRGIPEMIRAAQEYVRNMIDFIREFGLNENSEALPDTVIKKIRKDWLGKEHAGSERSELFRQILEKSASRRTASRFCVLVLAVSEKEKRPLRDPEALFTAGLILSLFWKPMLEKRISRQTAEESVTYLYSAAQIAGISCVDWKTNTWRKALNEGKKNALTGSFTHTCFTLLMARKPTDIELVEFKYLLGLTLTNGPGTISAKGAKESVSAGNHIPIAFAGFLANTGFAHGGNGFEAVSFLLDQFKNVKLDDPGTEKPPVNLEELAVNAAKAYGKYKQEVRETSRMQIRRIPCIGHPVFKGEKVNTDPREEFVRGELTEKGIRNLFLDFYHYLVKALFNEGVTRNVFCVNVDAVLAVIALKLVWKDYTSGQFSLKRIQDLVFTLFLLGRAAGVSAEIADHRDRGLDMDCRTPQSQVGYVI